ncbi:MAG: hypothetical protein K0U47_12555 [Epsilonproteobacteria bacterium]|nr:hypothetical protein [Campylobacterota bacterium]
MKYILEKFTQLIEYGIGLLRTETKEEKIEPQIQEEFEDETLDEIYPDKDKLIQ